MKDYESTSQNETDPGRPGSSATSGWRTVRRALSTQIGRWVVAAVAMCAVIGVSIVLAMSPSATAGSAAPASSSTAAPAAAGHAAGDPAAAGGGSNARSGPAAGGSSGTIDSVSASGFTMSTSAGQKVTVTEASSTTYLNGTTSTSASAMTKGASVLVLGTTTGTAITATQVSVQPAGGSTSSTASEVIAFERGAPSTAKQDGQIPTNYTEGSGTIVSGTTANKATEAALAAYPGGVVDRVVQLSNGEYEVHYIGVNWPHHIFVSQSFSVVGAD
jgi:hypothetical protein